MSMEEEKKSRTLLNKAGVALFALLFLLACVFGVYVSVYYHANSVAVEAMNAASIDGDKHYVFAAQGGEAQEQVGLVIYPGAKVEASAYAPLAQAVAQRGITCVICPMPFNMAFFDMDSLDDVIADHPEITHWYLAGHSLGGAMGAIHASEHASELDGLVLLAAYSTKDLSNTHLKVLSVYGSEDQVLSREKYEGSRTNLPENALELVIQGGDHAGFAGYGPQDGDGEASISPEEQIAQTADAIQRLAAA